MIKIIPRTATQYVAETLRSMLLNGEIKAGVRLRQDEISKQLGVSTTPVREALKQLAVEGLIIHDAYKGCIVKGFCKKDLDDIYELRVFLETKLIKETFDSFDISQIPKMEQICNKMTNIKDVQKWISLNGDFHTMFWESAKDSIIFNISENLKIQSIPYISLSLYYMPTHLTSSDKTHFDILEAYKKKDLKLAIKLNQAHLEDTRKIIHQAIINS